MKGQITMTREIREALKVAVENAIRSVGLENFKKTSMFMSNNRIEEVKKAA